MLKWSYFRENSSPKLNLINAFRKAKKLALISGKELKSLVIKGKLEENTISISF